MASAFASGSTWLLCVDTGGKVTRGHKIATRSGVTQIRAIRPGAGGRWILTGQIGNDGLAMACDVEGRVSWSLFEPAEAKTTVAIVDAAVLTTGTLVCIETRDVTQGLLARPSVTMAVINAKGEVTSRRDVGAHGAALGAAGAGADAWYLEWTKEDATSRFGLWAFNKGEWLLKGSSTEVDDSVLPANWTLVDVSEQIMAVGSISSVGGGSPLSHPALEFERVNGKCRVAWPQAMAETVLGGDASRQSHGDRNEGDSMSESSYEGDQRAYADRDTRPEYTECRPLASLVRSGQRGWVPYRMHCASLAAGVTLCAGRIVAQGGDLVCLHRVLWYWWGWLAATRNSTQRHGPDGRKRRNAVRQGTTRPAFASRPVTGCGWRHHHSYTTPIRRRR